MTPEERMVIPNFRRVNGDAQTRFWAKVDRRGDDECWPWLAAADDGYGRFGLAAGRITLAHRYVYELLVGPIPKGLTLDHLCRNRGCVNPTHLEPVTRGENVLRGVGGSAVNARKTHCIRGHEFNAENTYIIPGRNGRKPKRMCRPCRNLKRRKHPR